MADSRGEVTVLLGELKLGRKDALERLMPLVYREPTVKRDWAMAKAWMKAQLERGVSR